MFTFIMLLKCYLIFIKVKTTTKCDIRKHVFVNFHFNK